VNKKSEVTRRKKPIASENRGSLKKEKSTLNLDLAAFDFFSFSGFLKVLDLKVFSAI
jgi:hypothetical protein